MSSRSMTCFVFLAFSLIHQGDHTTGPVFCNKASEHQDQDHFINNLTLNELQAKWIFQKKELSVLIVYY